MSKLKTAHSMGFKVGDLVYSGAFPAIIISDVRTATPCLEVWGYEHECGSAYAQDLRKIDHHLFKSMVISYGYPWPLRAYSKHAIKTLSEIL